MSTMKHQTRINIDSSRNPFKLVHQRLNAFSGSVTFLSGLITAVLIPYIHIGIVNKLLWVPDKPEVDRETCTCSCFDTVYKGSYEKHGDSYKHMYFNTTSQMLKIWTVTVFFLLMLYECIRTLQGLITNGNARTTMVILFATNIYPMYYAWWLFFNYYNDDFYAQFYHQLFFTVTECASVAMVIQSCDARLDLVPKKLMLVISISTLHLILGSVDQFVNNVLLGDGMTYQQSRDIGLVIPDILHVALPAWELLRMARSRNSYRELFPKRDIRDCVLLVLVGLVVGHVL